MAIDFVVVDDSASTAKFASDLMRLTRSLRDVIDRLDFVKAVMEHSNNGTVFTQIEVLFGLPVGQGQTVYDLINGASMAIAGTAQNSNALSLINRVG